MFYAVILLCNYAVRPWQPYRCSRQPCIPYHLHDGERAFLRNATLAPRSRCVSTTRPRSTHLQRWWTFSPTSPSLQNFSVCFTVSHFLRLSMCLSDDGGSMPRPNLLSPTSLGLWSGGGDRIHRRHAYFVLVYRYFFPGVRTLLYFTVQYFTLLGEGTKIALY